MREMVSLHSMEEIRSFTEGHHLAFLYISSPDCSVCHALYPQIARLMMKYPLIHLGQVDAQEVKEVAGRFFVFTVPVLLLFVEGKEYIREARIVHLNLLDEKIRNLYDHVT